MNPEQQTQFDRAVQIIQLIANGTDMNAWGWDMCPWCAGFGDDEDTHEPCAHCVV